ncbi:hypothetical protein [Roseofilum capinflatum]|uniref:Uncharacterized protein n=1 Tax=Roseofilum capinflatum BLCC-M114 TaxID=3022440 RepID=A0ABT7B1L9_9CYAN|nr:hypothetical protein [Roseofilum capinflatum]MDJ1173058.1 hypothetical protein [Roseofilum capinflatum BLCC-M114]
MKRSFIAFGLCLTTLGGFELGGFTVTPIAVAQTASETAYLTSEASPIDCSDLPDGFKELRREWRRELEFDLEGEGMKIAGLFTCELIQPLAGQVEVVLGGAVIEPDMRDEITRDGSVFLEVAENWYGVGIENPKEHTEYIDGVGDRAVRSVMTSRIFTFPVTVNTIFFEHKEQVYFLANMHLSTARTDVDDIALAQQMVERIDSGVVQLEIPEPTPPHSPVTFNNALVNPSDLPNEYSSLRTDVLEKLQSFLSNLEIKGLFAYQLMEPLKMDLLFGGTIIKPNLQESMTTDVFDVPDMVDNMYGLKINKTGETLEFLDGVGNQAVRKMTTLEVLLMSIVVDVIVFEYDGQISFLVNTYMSRFPTQINTVALAKQMVERL